MISELHQERSAAASRARKAAVTWSRRILVTGVLAGASYQLVVQWPEMSRALSALPWQRVALSFVFVLVAIWLGPLMWRTVLADLGAPVPVRDASMIFLVGQLGKYVPGSIWAFLVQMELARAVGVTRTRSFAGSVVTMGLGMLASLLTGSLALPVILAGHREYLWVFAAAPLGLVLAHPRVLTWVVSRALRLLRRDPLPRPLTARAIVSTLILGVVSFVLLGIHLWLLADSLGAPGWSGLMLCVGAMSLAMTAGVLVFLLPSGIGVREVVIVAMLTSVLPAGPALTVALVSRLMFTVVDLASAGGAALLARARKGPR